jgi:uncharacterized protein
MIERKLKSVLIRSLTHFPVVGLVGSRQTGKTTLAKTLIQQEYPNAIYLDLETPTDLAKLDEPKPFFEANQDRLIILDEIHRRPELFPILRGIIDSYRRNGRLLVLGSASPALIKQTSESLAGRIIYHELPPFLLSELPESPVSQNPLWVRGGYPSSFFGETDPTSFEWREAFIRTILERDFPEFGFPTPAGQIHRFWQMLSHLHGQLWNSSKVAASLGIHYHTVNRYLYIFQDMFLLRILQPYYSNLKKRLVKSPKIYLRDSGLLHALLRIGDFNQLLGHPAIGSSWEGWVIEQILGNLPFLWDFYFYRTSAGGEIDLVLLPPGGKPPVAIEIKFTLSPSLSKGYKEAFSDLGCQKGFLIYPGRESFLLSREVTVLPVSNLQKVFSDHVE